MYEKTCRGCKELKPETEFHKRTISPDGLDTKCKRCRSIYVSIIPTKLEDAPEKHRIPAEEILTNLGFELYNDENPVYLQFNKRMSERGVDTSEW